jgi:hypothetical protein
MTTAPSKTTKIEKRTYKLYAIDKYNKGTKKFIDSEYKAYTLDDIVDKLETDKGYHMRICAGKNYVFFGDCDDFDGTFDEFAILLTYQ